MLKWAEQFSDHVELAIVVANYTSKFSFSYYTPHLEGEKIFGFTRQPIDCPLSANNDSHHLDRVSFSHPQVTVHTAQPNVVGNVGM